MDTSSSRNKSNGHSLTSSFSAFTARSGSPTGRFCSSSSSFSTFPARSSPITARSTSPTRINLYRSVSPSSSIRFSSTSPSRSISVTPRHHKSPSHHNYHQHHHHQQHQGQKKTCACSPSTHPGSFRCRLHKSQNNVTHQNHRSSNNTHHLNMRRSAMTNSLVRIGTVEGDLVKRALASLIRPSSHHLRRRGNFQPRPSRLSIMTKAEKH